MVKFTIMRESSEWRLLIYIKLQLIPRNIYARLIDNLKKTNVYAKSL